MRRERRPTKILSPRIIHVRRLSIDQARLARVRRGGVVGEGGVWTGGGDVFVGEASTKRRWEPAEGKVQFHRSCGLNESRGTCGGDKGKRRGRQGRERDGPEVGFLLTEAGEHFPNRSNERRRSGKLVDPLSHLPRDRRDLPSFKLPHFPRLLPYHPLYLRQPPHRGPSIS
jgi:hypothetical protein